jgi:hypothetical protein
MTDPNSPAPSRRPRARPAPIDPVLDASDPRAAAPAEVIRLGEPVELIVLACRINVLRCRLPGTAREIVLRTAVRDEVPGEFVTVVPTKQWTYGRSTHLAGAVQSRRMDVAALGLTPLALDDQGEWDPETDCWREETEPLAEWERAIVARGKRPQFEFVHVLPGVDPRDFEDDPLCDAVDLHAAGAREQARAIVMDLLARDLRCLDAHALLGTFCFDRRPAQAARHYEMGMNLGLLSLGSTFEGVLPWSHLDNRPFLRCLHGLGLCRWRLGRTEEAVAIFRQMLWLNPNDNQGVRFNLASIEEGYSWEQTVGGRR